MKVGIYTDAHFSVSSSILNTTSGYEYSARLDMLIESMRWMYSEFQKEGVDLIINAGDLIDSDFLKAREGSALSKALSYNYGIKEYHLVGNHEKEDKANKYTSLSLLSRSDNITIVDRPMKLNYEISLLPYTNNYDYELDEISNKVLISHVDYEGMQVGGIKLPHGMSMLYAENCFDLVLNGHIHSASTYGSKIVNIGSISGHGFDDDYSTCYPSIMILDTESLTFRRIINPHSVVFIKTKVSAISDLAKFMKGYAKLSNPICLKVEVPYSLRDDARDYLESIKDKYKLLGTRIQGRLDNTQKVNDKSEEIVKLQGYESGAVAMLKYVEMQEDNSLPSDKAKMKDFINRYLS